MESSVKHPVEEQVHDTLFPGENVYGPVLSIEVVMMFDAFAKVELIPHQGSVKHLRVLGCMPGEFVKRSAVMGHSQGFTP